MLALKQVYRCKMLCLRNLQVLVRDRTDLDARWDRAMLFSDLAELKKVSSTRLPANALWHKSYSGTEPLHEGCRGHTAQPWLFS